MDEKMKQSLDDDFETDYQNGDIKAVEKFFKKEKKLKFKGVDGWNRPVFQEEGTRNFYGDTDNLFSYSDGIDSILGFYKENPQKLASLCYFGRSFGCEPEGGCLPDDCIIVLK